MNAFRSAYPFSSHESTSTVSRSMGERASVREYIIVVVYIDYGGVIWRVLTLCRISRSILHSIEMSC